MTNVQVLPLVLLSLAAGAGAQQDMAERMARPGQPGGNVIYHVNFSKAAPGRSFQLGESVKKQEPDAPIRGHFLVLRHSYGDNWDFLTVEEMGPEAKVTLDGTPWSAAERDLRESHTDTFVVGPRWEEFAREMGIAKAPGDTAGSVYVVSTYRALPGHRDGIEKLLRGPAAQGDTVSGHVVMQHLEGGDWNFVEISRYNSWQDVAKSEESQRPGMSKSSADWYQMREHTANHTDTIADRIAP